MHRIIGKQADGEGQARRRRRQRVVDLQLNRLAIAERLRRRPHRPGRLPAVHPHLNALPDQRDDGLTSGGERRPVEQDLLVRNAQIVRNVEDVRDDRQFHGGAGQADVDIAERRGMRRGGRRANQPQQDADEECSHR